MSHTKVTPENKSFPIEITLQMFKSIICGRGNFHVEDDEQEDHHQWTPLSTPKKSSSNSSTPRKSFSNSSTPKNTTNTRINPYSNRGLDKFATVLAELEEKRQQIYEHVSPKDIDVVQFNYSITQDCWVPIVVKVKDDKQEKPELLLVHGGNDTKENQKSAETLEAEKSSSSIEMFKEEPKPSSENNIQKKKKKGIMDMGKWRRPSSYWPLMLIAFILFCLVIFGRSFAIIFTTMFWYLKPIVKGEDEILMKRLSTKKKKESVRKKMMINGDGYSYHKGKKLELGSSLQR